MFQSGFILKDRLKEAFIFALKLKILDNVILLLLNFSKYRILMKTTYEFGIYSSIQETVAH